jgi:hypothetical protein
LLKPHFQNPYFSRSKHFWTKCAQMGYKNNFISSSPFSLLIINAKILSNFQKEWCTFGRKKNVWKKQGLSIIKVWVLLNMQNHFWFVLSFEHVNFAINGKYFKKLYDNPNYYAFIVIFQTYKNAVLKSVQSLGWLLLLWFYPFALW